MSYQVWAYKLEAKTRQEVELPWGSQILKVAVVGNAPLIWALVDTTASSKRIHEFRLYECDEVIPDADQLQYLGTFAMAGEDREAVIHCFEARRVIV